MRWCVTTRSCGRRSSPTVGWCSPRWVTGWPRSSPRRAMRSRARWRPSWGLADHEWGVIGPLRARMGLHAGEGELRADGHYVNQPLNRCARLMAIAHGGQVVVSETVESLVAGGLADGGDAGRPGRAPVAGSDRHAPGVPGRASGAGPGVPAVAVVERAAGEPAPPGHHLRRPGRGDRVAGRSGAHVVVGDADRRRRCRQDAALALQVAAEVVTAFPDGAWLCEFGPVTDPDAVWDALAASLRVQPYPGRNLDELVLEYLAAKRLLLVLDNAEHLLDAVARQVDAIVQRCERVVGAGDESGRTGAAGRADRRRPLVGRPRRRRRRRCLGRRGSGAAVLGSGVRRQDTTSCSTSGTRPRSGCCAAAWTASPSPSSWRRPGCGRCRRRISWPDWISGSSS